MDPRPENAESLGASLRQARESRGWSREHVARELKLPLGTIADLEDERYERFSGPVYVKGFLRSYLRLLEMPEIMLGRLPSEWLASEAKLAPVAGAVARRVSWVDRYKWAASYVVGTGLALTAVHWLVTNTPQLSLPEVTRAPQPASGQSTPLPMPAPDAIREDAGFESAGAAGASRVTPAPAADTAVMASMAPFRVPTARSAPELVIDFDQDSWVEVLDAEGQKLESTIVRANQQRRYPAESGMRLRIGNVRGVRVQLGSESIAMDEYARSNVARLQLSDVDGRLAVLPVERRSGGAANVSAD